MGWWSDIRDPAISSFTPAGPLGGLGYDALTNKGLFQPDNSGQGNPYAGMPGYPGYVPTYDNSMAVSPSGPGGKYLENEALRSGPSPWAALQTQQQNTEETMARDRAAKNSAGATQGAMQGLASGGGLTTGARERAQEGGANAYTAAAQEAAKQGSLNRMQVGINDEQNRIQNIGTAAGLENQDALANLAASMKNKQGLNDYNQNMYATQGNIWGAGQQANATANSGGGFLGSFICTELKKRGLMNKRESALMLKFMLRGILKRANFMLFYLKNAPKAIAVLNAKGFDWSTVKSMFVDQVLETIEIAGDEAGQDLYINKTLMLMALAGLPYKKTFTKNRFKIALHVPRLFLNKQLVGWYLFGGAR